MNCAEVKPWLPELAGGELGPVERARCEAHVQGCAACATALSQLREAVGLLRRVGQATAPPAGFAQALHRRLAQEPPPRRPLGVRLWEALGRLGLDSGPRLSALVGVAAAGVLLVAIGLSGGRAPLVRAPSPPAGGAGPALAEVAAPFQVPSRRVAVVHFDFVTDATIDEVQFEVTLPQGLAFISDGKPLAQRTLQWSGALVAGSNPIPLAVSGNKPGRYTIIARARGSGVEVKHDVLLEVVSS